MKKIPSKKFLENKQAMFTSTIYQQTLIVLSAHDTASARQQNFDANNLKVFYLSRFSEESSIHSLWSPPRKKLFVYGCTENGGV